MNITIWLKGMLVCVLALGGCTFSPMPAQVPSSPTVSALPTATATVIPTTPSPTVAPSPTLTPSPTVEPQPTTTRALAPTIAPTPTGETRDTNPIAVTAVRLVLARQLGITLSATSVISYESVDWPNACLGAARTKRACADVITPGYRVLLKAGENTYEFHTNGDGGAYVLVEPAGGKTVADSGDDVVLVWHRSGGFAGFCDNVIIMTDDQYTVSPCGGRKTPITSTLTLGAAARQQLHVWRDHFGLFSVRHPGPVSPDELVIEFTFYGHGSIEPTADDKQAISLFAQQLIIATK